MRALVTAALTEMFTTAGFTAAMRSAKLSGAGVAAAGTETGGPVGVTVNAVCPGPINTGMTEPIPDDAKAIFSRRRVPLQRYGQPEEVAHATLGFVLPAASYTNGAVLLVDGGFSIQN